MINAVIQGKSKGCEYWEDMLTSTVLGTLRYLPKGLALIPFLESSILYDNSRTQFWKVLKRDGIELRNYNTIKFYFWTRHSQYGEPDLVLLFTDHVHDESDLLLVIEAKFKSGKSGEEDNDQLMRYYKAISEGIDGFDESEISNFKGTNKYIVYLTEAEALSEIENSIRCINENCKGFNGELFHLRWQQLHDILINNCPFFTSNERIIAEDLISYLETLGLREFNGISSPDKSVVDKIDLTSNVFYKVEESRGKDILYFRDLPKINIDTNTYSFYREGTKNE